MSARVSFLAPAHDIDGSTVDVALTVSDFWRMVDRSAGPDACHPWLGYVENGYGLFAFFGRKIGAHELAVLFTTGEVRPAIWETCHACHNPLCCNPAHLRYGSRQDNVNDMTAAGRQSRGERNGQAKLTENQVLEIRYRAQNGAVCKSIAAEYGVSEGLVSEIVRGRRWAHVGGPIRTDHGNRRHGKFARRSTSK